MNFNDIFFHDVLIKEISINLSFKENEETKDFKFQLESFNYDNIICVFEDIRYLNMDFYLNIIGSISIINAYISVEDPSLDEFKAGLASYIPESLLEKMKCYNIETTVGKMKFITEYDFKIF